MLQQQQQQQQQLQQQLQQQQQHLQQQLQQQQQQLEGFTGRERGGPPALLLLSSSSSSSSSSSKRLRFFLLSKACFKAWHLREQQQQQQEPQQQLLLPLCFRDFPRFFPASVLPETGGAHAAAPQLDLREAPPPPALSSLVALLPNETQQQQQQQRQRQQQLFEASESPVPSFLLSPYHGGWAASGGPVGGGLLAAAAAAAAAGEDSEVYDMTPALPGDLALEEVDEAAKEADALLPSLGEWPLLVPPPDDVTAAETDGDTLEALQRSLESSSSPRDLVVGAPQEDEVPEVVPLSERGEGAPTSPPPLPVAPEPSAVVRPLPTNPALKTDLLAYRRRTRGNTEHPEETTESLTAPETEGMLPPYKGSEELFVGGLLLAASGFLQMQGLRSQTGFFVVMVFAILGFLTAALGIYSQITSRNRRKRWIKKQGSLLDHLRN
ncbi:hypothetical protein Emed_006720 [Eimeria media]